VSELSALQNVANQALLQKIKVTAQEEILQKYFKESAQAQKDLIEMQIQQERYKAGERNFAPVVYTAQGYIDRIKKLQAESTEADKNLNAFLSRMPELGVNANDIKTKGMSEAQQQAMSQLKSKMPASFVNSNINKMDTDAFIQSADSTAKMAAGGGLGQAKVINMNFNEPLMQINAGTLDSDDLQADAEKIIEQLTVELHQMAYETGTV
jgi:hypothetical protein